MNPSKPQISYLKFEISNLRYHVHVSRENPMKRWALCVLVAIAGLAAPARAAILFSYFTDQSNYSANPGQAVPVSVSLRETVTGSDTSLLVSDGGLAGAGVKLVQTNSPVSPSVIASLAGIQGDPAFDGGAFPQLPPPYLLEIIALPPSAGVTGVDKGGGVREVHLGTFTFTAGGPGVTDLQTAPFSASSADTVTDNSLMVLDQRIAPSSFTITVTAVPEPATLSLLTASALFILARPARTQRQTLSI
jgi:hypothetical protein